MSDPRSFVWTAGLVFCAMCGSARADSSISFSLGNPGQDAVQSGTDVLLEIRATFDTRLSAAAFRLGASGDAGLSMVGRSLDPVGSNGLTYISPTSQDPFQSGLPHDLIAGSIIEVAADTDFDLVPGGATDGLPAGVGVLIETVTVRPIGAGTVTISLTDVAAAHTTASPNGSMFDVASVGTGTVVLSVSANPGDYDEDGDVDLADFVGFTGCMTGPTAGSLTTACQRVDFDADNDVDARDFGEFQMLFTGPF